MPTVAATLVPASSTGMPAAISAPKASSIRISVTGRLSVSAADRSSATRSSIAASRLTSPLWRTSSCGKSAWTALVTCCRGATSSWSRASWIETRYAVPSGLTWGSATSSTPGSSVIPATTAAAASWAWALFEVAGLGADQHLLGVGVVEPGRGDHRIGAAGLAEPVVGVGGLVGRDHRGQTDGEGNERNPAEDRAPRVEGAPAGGAVGEGGERVRHGSSLRAARPQVSGPRTRPVVVLAPLSGPAGSGRMEP